MTDRSLLQNYPKVYDGKYAEIYDMSAEIPGVAFAFWKGFFRLSDPEFISDLLWSVQYIKDSQLKVYISDHSYLQIVTPDVLDWVHQNWYAPAVKNGLIAEVSIDATNLFAQITLEKMLDEKKTGQMMTPKVKDLEHGKELTLQILERSEKPKEITI